MSYFGYRDLIVWQKAMDLVDEVYSLVKHLPREELYALSDQMRRAAVSIPSNIAEGHGRKARREFLQFLSIATGSVFELETQLSICVRQRYLTEEQVQKALALCEEVGRILTRISTKSDTNGEP